MSNHCFVISKRRNISSGSIYEDLKYINKMSFKDIYDIEYSKSDDSRSCFRLTSQFNCAIYGFTFWQQSKRSIEFRYPIDDFSTWSMIYTKHYLAEKYDAYLHLKDEYGTSSKPNLIKYNTYWKWIEYRGIKNRVIKYWPSYLIEKFIPKSELNKIKLENLLA